jgi:hypothetical protein
VLEVAATKQVANNAVTELMDGGREISSRGHAAMSKEKPVAKKGVVPARVSYRIVPPRIRFIFSGSLVFRMMASP